MQLGVRPLAVKLAYLFFALFNAAVLLPARAQKSCSNDEVVKMVQAHLGTDIILEQIRNATAHYCLSADMLIKLRNQGVPDEVISAMQARMNGQRRQGRSGDGAKGTTTAKAEVDSIAEGGQGKQVIWRVGHQEVSGHDEYGARTSIPILSYGHKGVAQIVATCEEDGPNFMQKYFIWFRIKYASQDSPTTIAGKARTPTIEQDPDTVYKPTIFGPGTIIHGEIHETHFPAYVPIEASIDSRYVSKDLDYVGGGIRLTFESVYGDMKPTIDPDSVGSVSDVYNAHTIRVQFPLTNGDKPTIEIHPQDPSFRPFLDTCSGFIPSELTKSKQDGSSAGLDEKQAQIANMVQQANAELDQGRNSEAFTLYTEILVRDPNNTSAKAGIAKIQQIPAWKAWADSDLQWDNDCKQGIATACTKLGTSYCEGWGVAKNAKKAIQLWDKSCLMGDRLGCQYSGEAHPAFQWVPRGQEPTANSGVDPCP